MYFKTNNMKNYLLPKNEIKFLKTDGFVQNLNFKKRQVFLMARSIIILIVFLIVTLALSSTTGYAQTVDNVNNYIQTINSIEAQQLENFIEGEESTLFIYGNEFEVEGSSAPVIADVSLESFDQIYNSNTKFDKIELIRLKVRNSNDLKSVLNVGNLSHFQNLKYIYVMVIFDICPENQNDIECQKSEIRKMFSFPEETTSPVVLFKTVSLM